MAGVRSKTIKRYNSIVIYAVVTILIIVVLFPILWTLSTSFKPVTEIRSYPPHWIPKRFILDNYFSVIFHSQLPRYFLNSTIVSVSAVALSIIVGALAAFVFRFKFPGKGAILGVIIGLVMLGGGGLAGLVALYLTFKALHLIDTYAVLIIPYGGWALPFTIFLMYGFFESIPSSLEDAAIIDGCNIWQLFYKIFIPLAKPGIAAIAILNFVGNWNEFLVALTFIRSPSMRTLPLGIYSYITTRVGVTLWGEGCAAAILASLPMLILFAVLQKHFISGILKGAIKG